MNNTEGKHEPKQFSCFDDHNNDGWGNSTLDETPYIPDEENETEPEDQDYPNELSESISNRPIKVTEGFSCVNGAVDSSEPQILDKNG